MISDDSRTTEHHDDAHAGGLSLHVLDRDASWREPLPEGTDVVVGRGAGAGIRLADAAVSRAHARLRVRDGLARIADLTSANGIEVNGERVAGERQLAPRDVITLGGSTLILQVSARGAAAPLPWAELERRVAGLLEEAAGGGRVVSFVLLSLSAAPAVALPEEWEVGWISPRELLALLPDVPADLVRAVADRMVDRTAAPGRVTAACATAPGDGDTPAALVDRLRELTAAGDAARVSAGTIRRIALGDDVLVVGDPEMARIYQLLEHMAPTDLPVLLGGETGVGKEVAARFLHGASARARGPFVVVSCAGLPESLAESELFGYERGAFPGAVGARPGLLEIGSGGTVFLDDVGELSPAMQARLLRVLDTRRARRLGDVRERELDLRLVSATSRDLAAECKAGRFRQDLFFRLMAAHVRVPPLRERPAEVLALARLFLDQAGAGRRRSPLRLAPAAAAALAQHAWPGNVRELRSVCDDLAAAVTGGDVVEVGHLPPLLRAEPAPPTVTSPALAPPGPPAVRGVREEVRDHEKRRVLEALELCGGNQTRAALLIGMPRRTLVAKLRQYGIRKRVS